MGFKLSWELLHYSIGFILFIFLFYFVEFYIFPVWKLDWAICWMVQCIPTKNFPQSSWRRMEGDLGFVGYLGKRIAKIIRARWFWDNWRTIFIEQQSIYLYNIMKINLQKNLQVKLEWLYRWRWVRRWWRCIGRLHLSLYRHRWFFINRDGFISLLVEIDLSLCWQRWFFIGRDGFIFRWNRLITSSMEISFRR